MCDQWETFNTRHQYADNSKKYRAIRNSNLKEVFVVRYADDFKILCKDYETAKNIYTATKDWLRERLGLEVSPDKSKITNVRKGKTEFLGFKLFVQKKRNIYVTRSEITDKAKTAIKAKLKEQIKIIRTEPTVEQVNLLNSKILGVHQYYEIASRCSKDFNDINFVVSKSLRNRLRGQTKKVKGRKKRNNQPETKPAKSKTHLKFYGDYNPKPVIVAGTTIFPIYGCKYKSPKSFTQEVNKYTVLGRKLIHSKLGNVKNLVRHLLKCKEYDKSVEYNDNRISLMAGQNGKCGVTGECLTTGNMECHHKKPKELGGSDEYKNLMWVKTEVHRLIHATTPETIEKYLTILQLDSKALKKVNSLRLSAENLEIGTTAI